LFSSHLARQCWNQRSSTAIQKQIKFKQKIIQSQREQKTNKQTNNNTEIIIYNKTTKYSYMWAAYLFVSVLVTRCSVHQMHRPGKLPFHSWPYYIQPNQRQNWRQHSYCGVPPAVQAIIPNKRTQD